MAENHVLRKTCWVKRKFKFILFYSIPFSGMSAVRQTQHIAHSLLKIVNYSLRKEGQVLKTYQLERADVGSLERWFLSLLPLEAM